VVDIFIHDLRDTMTIVKWVLFLLLMFLLLSACATVPRPTLDYCPGAAVETLSSAVSLSIHTADRSMGGHGYLVYRRPDQVHLVVLSPFGSTLFEVFALGERITLVYPAQSTAYSGRFDELPDKGGLQGWRLMRWVMDIDPPGESRLNGTVERMGRLGFEEKVSFENGLVTSKASRNGEQVYYSNYIVVNSVPIAAEIELRNEHEDRIRLSFEEPEINTPLEDSAFIPRLDGMTILPLSAIQGL
jgi:hypothetical protein